MFFMMGITEEQKQLAFNQLVVCAQCGSYGRYEVFRLCTVLSLFFIPCFRWNRRYVVRTACCGAVYEIDPELGRAIERGEITELREEDLRLVSSGRGREKVCGTCGFRTTEDYEFCPKCGRPF